MSNIKVYIVCWLLLVISIYCERASTPICESVTLNGNQIRTTCTTAEVFPQAKCQFTLQNGGLDRRHIEDGTTYITYTHTDSHVNEYYSTSCTLQYPVDGLKPGAWTVEVNMYPDLAGVSLAQGTTGQAHNALQLSVPTVNIDSTTCPKGLAGEGDTNVGHGYIRQGKLASCLCVRVHAGNPPGTIGWSSTKGGNFAIVSHSADTATIQINSPDTFTCQSKSVLDGSHSMTYTPKYAYGPNDVIFSFVNNQFNELQNKPLNLCDSEGLDVTVICAVKQSDVRPGMTLAEFTLSKPSTFYTQQTYMDTSGGGHYRSLNKLKVTSGGSYILMCEAKNPKFSDIKQTHSMTVEVREPPREPPKMSARSIQNGDILMEEDDVTVTCEVTGGYPAVQSVTLTCVHDQSVTNNGTSAKLTLKEIGPSYNETNCTCQATHVTGCYDAMGVLPLIVLKLSTQAPEHVQNRVSFVDYIRTRVSDHWEDSEIVIS